MEISKDRKRNWTIDWVFWILGQVTTNAFWKVCVIKGDDFIKCGLDEIWTEEYYKNLQHYRVFIIYKSVIFKFDSIFAEWNL